jgi:hypothetical protein
VTLANRVIRLEAQDSKSADPRIAFLCDQAYDILKVHGKLRLLDHYRGFTWQGKLLQKIKTALFNACRQAGRGHYWIMKLTGRKTSARCSHRGEIAVPVINSS